MTQADPESYRLAYEEAKRALEEQERAVVELRSRAGQLIAAAAITTSFFGGQALHRHIHTLGWVAIGCFVGLSLAVLHSLASAGLGVLPVAGSVHRHLRRAGRR